MTFSITLLGAGLLQAFVSQSGPGAEKGDPEPRPARVVEWISGTSIPVRVPVGSSDHAYMTSISFPEESLETAVTGWADGEITAIQKRGLLFLRLSRPSEGQLHVIGGSGAHYLLYLKGAQTTDAAGFDTDLKIQKRAEPTPPHEVLRRDPPRPGAPLLLLEAMRRGLHPEGVKVLRVSREVAARFETVELRLRYIFDAPSYWGLVYDAKNVSDRRAAIDVSRIRCKGATLILSALRDNVVGPGETTRLYAVLWKE